MSIYVGDDAPHNPPRGMYVTERNRGRGGGTGGTPHHPPTTPFEFLADMIPSFSTTNTMPHSPNKQGAIISPLYKDMETFVDLLDRPILSRTLDILRVIDENFRNTPKAMGFKALVQQIISVNPYVCLVPYLSMIDTAMVHSPIHKKFHDAFADIKRVCVGASLEFGETSPAVCRCHSKLVVPILSHLFRAILKNIQSEFASIQHAGIFAKPVAQLTLNALNITLKRTSTNYEGPRRSYIVDRFVSQQKYIAKFDGKEEAASLEVWVRYPNESSYTHGGHEEAVYELGYPDIRSPYLIKNVKLSELLEYSNFNAVVFEKQNGLIVRQAGYDPSQLYYLNMDRRNIKSGNKDEYMQSGRKVQPENLNDMMACLNTRGQRMSERDGRVYGSKHVHKIRIWGKERTGKLYVEVGSPSVLTYPWNKNEFPDCNTPIKMIDLLLAARGDAVVYIDLHPTKRDKASMVYLTYYTVELHRFKGRGQSKSEKTSLDATMQPGDGDFGDIEATIRDPESARRVLFSNERSGSSSSSSSSSSMDLSQ